MSDTTLPQLSRILAIACRVLVIVVPVVTVIALGLQRWDWISGGPESTTARLGALLVGLLPLVIFVWTLEQMRGLFQTYAHGAVLTAEAAQRIVDIGKGFLALALAPLVVKPVTSVLSSLGNPRGERELVLTVDSNTFFFALISGLLIVIGFAMRQAAEMAEDHRAIV